MEQTDQSPGRVGLIVLAAGAGSRMRSAIPKPLHTVAGVPMLTRVLRAGSGLSPAFRVVVASPDSAGQIVEAVGAPDVEVVIQNPPRGTGDAVRIALDAMPNVDQAVVLYSDHPLLEPETVRRLAWGAQESGANVTVLTVIVADASGYGRIVRDDRERIVAVVERRDDDPVLRVGSVEINSGMMALDAVWARAALLDLRPSTETGEFYLTELVAMAVEEARSDGPWPVAAVRGGEDDAAGVNDRLDLARAESRAWERKRERLMRAGVTLRLPETIVVDEDVEIGPDTVVLPYTSLHGTTRIGGSCVLGPATTITDSDIGERVYVRSSTVVDSSIADDSDVGPYSHLRGGSQVGSRVHVGNYAELKNARLAPGVKVGHFSYLGDTTVGEETNIGAGTITANFDGANKFHTDIGAHAFIGSDTILRAPVRIGDGARTGAGSVVTRDVPDGVTVVGVPARPAPRFRSQAGNTAVEKEER